MPTARALQSAGRDIHADIRRHLIPHHVHFWSPGAACERARWCLSHSGSAVTPVTIRHDGLGPVLIFALV